MDDWQTTRMTDAELKHFFDRLFPAGFAGVDVVQELAPTGWENSQLLACFHPSPEQVFQEQLQLHRNIEAMGRTLQKRSAGNPEPVPPPEPTMEDVLVAW